VEGADQRGRAMQIADRGEAVGWTGSRGNVHDFCMDCGL
jgi:hypothetical protein